MTTQEQNLPSSRPASPWKEGTTVFRDASGQLVEYSLSADVSAVPELYASGQSLPRLHPDDAINQELLIAALCEKLDTARQALAGALQMNVVTPAAVSMKNTCRWALDETHPKTLYTQHPNVG